LDELTSLFAFGPTGWGDEIASGAGLTIELALATLPFGLVVGLLVAMAKLSNRKGWNAAGNAFTTVFRGLPELLTIFIVFFGGQVLFGRLVKVFGDTDINVSPFLAGVVALGLVFAAYSSEVFVAAVRAIPFEQHDAGYALGLTERQNFVLVILPQVVRIALPGIGNLWLVLLKDTSLVSVIAFNDLIRETSVAVGVTKQPFAFFLLACFIYLAFSIVSSLLIVALEWRSERGLRSA
jgi:polar amino acid transport system permease protein